MDIAASDDLPEMTAYLTQQNRAQRKAEKEKKAAAAMAAPNSTRQTKPPKVPEKEKKVSATTTTSSTRKALPALPTVPDNKKTETKRTLAPATAPIKKPSLRRQPNFISENLGSENQKRRVSSVENLAKLQVLRTRIREGKLEKVVPPPSNSFSEGRLAPPRPTQNPFLRHVPSRSSSKRTAPRSGKNSSASSRVVSLIGTSADLMDATRREIAGKFRPPFEHLNHQAWWDEKTKERKERKGSEGSIESFCCVGEEVPKKEEDKVQALKQRQTENGKRVSGEGTSPWVKAGPSSCRLCGKGGVGGVRGLCRECEDDFMRPEDSPKIRRRSSWSSSCCSDDEVKPTPPLKDRNTLLLRNQVDGSKLVYQINQQDEYHQKLQAKTKSNRPEILEPTPQRPISQRAIFDYESDSESESESESEEENHRNWQTRSMKDEFEKSQKLFSRWSSALGEDVGFQEETPLVGKGQVERDSHFYDFYDDLLENEVEPRVTK